LQLLEAFKVVATEVIATESRLHEIVDELAARTRAGGLDGDSFELNVREWAKANDIEIVPNNG
jgi:hypothetical protein